MLILDSDQVSYQPTYVPQVSTRHFQCILLLGRRGQLNKLPCTQPNPCYTIENSNRSWDTPIDSND